MKNRGFTLVEVLVAVGILVIGMAGVIAIFTTALGWAREVKHDLFLAESAKSAAQYASLNTPSTSFTALQIPSSEKADAALNSYWWRVKAETGSGVGPHQLPVDASDTAGAMDAADLTSIPTLYRVTLRAYQTEKNRDDDELSLGDFTFYISYD